MTDPLGTYVIAAGGTGGHIIPGIALAAEIRTHKPASDIVFVGTGQGLEGKIVPAAGYTLELIDASGFVGKTWTKQVGSLSKLPRAVLESRALLRRYRARVVIGVGGYVTVPVLMAARSLGIPTVIHESNAMPGVSNRFLNRFSTRTAVGLAAANAHLRRPGVVTGTPVRRDFFAVPPMSETATTRRLLVFGGSQGSRVINRAMARSAVLLEKSGLEVIHQTGDKDLGATRARYPRVPQNWNLVPFLPRLHEEMAWADLVLSRAGAMTLAELSAAGRPAILVPFGASSSGHQLENARAVTRAGGAVLIREPELTAENLAGTISELFEKRERLIQMSQRARTLAKPDAARDLARMVFEAEVSR